MAPPRSLRLAMAQINAVVGDLEGNARKIIDWMRQARDLGADLVMFPELAVTGYPPEDLLLKQGFVDSNLEALSNIASEAIDIVAVVGFVDRADDIYNAAAVLTHGDIGGVYHKKYLPNYGVFDEFRYFKTGHGSTLIEFGETRVGVTICEDIWHPDGPAVEQAMGAGAEVVLNISSSPFHRGKRHWRERMLATRAADATAIVAYTNLVGGQDELVFDGDSLIFDAKGDIVARGAQFEEEMITTDLDLDAVFRTRLQDPRRRQRSEADPEIRVIPGPSIRLGQSELPATKPCAPLDPDAEVFRALVLGTRDYVRKNGFEGVVVALSGGIDSALTVAIAVEAVGSENVVGVMMPSEFSSRGSVSDSEVLGKNLGIRLIRIPISNLMDAYSSALKPSFAGREPDVTEENIQARIRGNLVMALSNKFGWLVLSTGNKSEVSVGYCTLYGDMAGGFAALKDVTKTTVYRLAEYCNRAAGVERIPKEIIHKEPSAELRPGQKDVDSLPPYPELDPVLEAYVEDDRSVSDMIEMGFDADVIRRVVNLVDGSEYKRRQAPPGVKITHRAFGRDRRMPITNRFGKQTGG